MRDAVISPRICVAFVYTEAVVGKQDPWRRPVCLQNDLQENMKYSGTASKPTPALYLTLSGQTDRQTDRPTAYSITPCKTVPTNSIYYPVSRVRQWRSNAPGGKHLLKRPFTPLLPPSLPTPSSSLSTPSLLSVINRFIHSRIHKCTVGLFSYPKWLKLSVTYTPKILHPWRPPICDARIATAPPRSPRYVTGVGHKNVLSHSHNCGTDWCDGVTAA